MSLNPNKDRDEVNRYCELEDAGKSASYPLFFEKLELVNFRHIRNMELNFQHPITVICGSNRCGKTSALMAIACSHYNFYRHNVTNGAWVRTTWGTMMRFTQVDRQFEDWSYRVTYREGRISHCVHGYRRQSSAKWGGVAKRGRQIGKPTSDHPYGGREVTLIDLNRITPGRHLSQSYYNKARRATPTLIPNSKIINDYMSYILEDEYQVQSLTQAGDGQVYLYHSNATYSSFNTASGEDVLMALLTDILRTKEYSLVMIDEIEVGLHPKVQRRLIDVLYMISKSEHKQFIISTHSYAILSSVPEQSRIFIDNKKLGGHVIECVSTYEALTRMDSDTFPVCSIYIEDDVSKYLVEKAILEINRRNNGFSRLIRLVIVGSAQATYDYYITRQRLINDEKIVTKAACVLDGDMRNARLNNGTLCYPPQGTLFFHFSNEAPEKMLLRKYLCAHSNDTLQYHLESSNPHCLMQHMVDEGIACNITNALDLCFAEYVKTEDGAKHFESLQQFLESLV